MKSKWKWVYNPFEFVAGWQALLFGVILLALTAIIGKMNGIAFDGVLDVHVHITPLSFMASFAMQVVNFITLFLTMWLSGVCFSKSRLRAIDVAGTMALARAPMLLFAVICFLPIVPAKLYDIPNLIIFSILSIPFFIWMIALMYNAYSVSCNLKGTKAVVSFIGALLVAEILSKLIFIFLLSSLFTNSPMALGKLKTYSTGNTVLVSDSLTNRQKTEKVVNALEQSNFDAITIYFDATMKKKLSPNLLKAAWIQTIQTCGQFEKADITGLKETRFGIFDVIEVPLFFQKDKRNLRLAFNGSGEISGLFFLKINN